MHAHLSQQHARALGRARADRDLERRLAPVRVRVDARAEREADADDGRAAVAAREQQRRVAEPRLDHAVDTDLAEPKAARETHNIAFL